MVILRIVLNDLFFILHGPITSAEVPSFLSVVGVVYADVVTDAACVKFACDLYDSEGIQIVVSARTMWNLLYSDVTIFFFFTLQRSRAWKMIYLQQVRNQTMSSQQHCTFSEPPSVLLIRSTLVKWGREKRTRILIACFQYKFAPGQVSEERTEANTLFGNGGKDSP